MRKPIRATVLYLRSPQEFINFFARIDRAALRSDLNFFEQALIGNGIMPVSFLLKHSPPRVVYRTLAQLEDAGQIQRVRQNDVELVIPIPPKIKPFRAGRYTKAVHPRDYKPQGSRDKIPIPIGRKDRNLLWYLGEGRLGEGLEGLCHWFRKTMDPGDYPHVPKDVL